ncbi:MAG: sulfite exporter TauE/SafE family protein [Acidobacteria bacterium]|nr:sulfite exporter TauE/SafE family protein [Acidobacteriota bacterium]
MPPLTILIPVILILFTAAFIRSSVGFGDAVLAMPLLALLIPVKTATPLVAFCATTMTVSILIGSWRKTDWRITFRLVVATLIGIPPGLFLLKKMPDDILELILGFFCRLAFLGPVTLRIVPIILQVGSIFLRDSGRNLGQMLALRVMLLQPVGE